LRSHVQILDLHIDPVADLDHILRFHVAPPGDLLEGIKPPRREIDRTRPNSQYASPFPVATIPT
jgi:hypothetical protein